MYLSSSKRVSTTDLIDQRNVTLSNGSTGPVTLDPYSDTDALARISTSAQATCELAVDRMQYGDFEERDVDDVAAEGDRWSQTSARYVQRHTKRTGQAAAVLLRSSSNSSKAIFHFSLKALGSFGTPAPSSRFAS